MLKICFIYVPFVLAFLTLIYVHVRCFDCRRSLRRIFSTNKVSVKYSKNVESCKRISILRSTLNVIGTVRSEKYSTQIRQINLYCTINKTINKNITDSDFSQTTFGWSIAEEIFRQYVLRNKQINIYLFIKKRYVISTSNTMPYYLTLFNPNI